MCSLISQRSCSTFAMEGDDTPLLVVTPGDETESEKDLDTSKDILKDMVLFHGKVSEGRGNVGVVCAGA